MKIQLTLSPNTNSLDFELHEAVSLDDVNALINSDLLKENLCVYNNTYYPNERTLLKAYKDLYTKNGFKTKWAKPKSKWGRVFPVKSLSLTTMPRNIRETLMKDRYYITDLKNAQPCILRNICKAYNIKCESLDEYCEDRDKYLKDIMEFYNVDRYLAKKLVLNIGFGGEIKSWVEEWDGKEWKGNKYEMKNTTKTMTFLRSYIAEMKTICEELQSKNTALYKSCYDKYFKKEGIDKVRRSFFATYCQEQEFQIVYAVFKYLYNETDIMDLNGVKVGVYEYDGINLPIKDNIEDYYEVCRLLKQKTLELTGFNLDWDIKDMDDYEDISKWQGVVNQEEATFATLFENCEKLFDKLNSTGVIESVEEMAPGHFIFKVEDKGNGTWYCWDEEKNRWVNNSHPLRKSIVYKLCNKWTEEVKMYQGILEDLELSPAESKQITNMLSKITDFCKKGLKDDTICNKCIHHAETLMEGAIDFDNSSLLFGCNNGVLDIEKGVFRPYTFEDKMTYTCGYDFVPIAKGVSYINPTSGRKATIMGETAENKIILTDISNVILQIMPNDTHRDLLLTILSSTLIGKSIEKFFIFNGKGRNGKGVINEFMAVVLGKDYATTASPNLFTEDTSKKQTGGVNPEIAKLDNKRMILASEFPENATINNAVMKAITGGNDLCGRMCRSNNTLVRNRATTIIECNIKPGLATEPTPADAERIVDFPFGSFFTFDENLHDITKHIYPVRPELKTTEWKDIHKNAMLNLLFLHAIEFKKNNYQIDKYIPDDIKDRSQEYLQNSRPIYKVFRELYEYKGVKSCEGYVYDKSEDLTIAKIITKIRSSSNFLVLPRAIQQKYDTAAKMKEWVYDNEFFKQRMDTDPSNKQKFLRGWREIPIENCEEE